MNDAFDYAELLKVYANTGGGKLRVLPRPPPASHSFSHALAICKFCENWKNHWIWNFKNQR